MWRDYSLGYLKKNRTSAISLMAAAFIASLFLSLLCCLSYNFWIYEIEQIILEEGDWEGRITGELGEEKLALIEKFANVEQVKPNPKVSEQMGETVTDLYFRRKGSVYQDMELIADKLELEPEAVSVHKLLLSRYLVRDPLDETPPLLLPFFLTVVLLASLSLILITLPLTAAAAAFMIKASYLDPAEFLAKAPIIPILLFILCVFAFVALAYYLGGRKILACDLSDVLQDDSLM